MNVGNHFYISRREAGGRKAETNARRKPVKEHVKMQPARKRRAKKHVTKCIDGDHRKTAQGGFMEQTVATRLPLDLQLFADSEQQSEQESAQAASPDTGAKTTAEGGSTEPQTNEQSSEPQYTVEGLLAKVAEQNAMLIKMKSDYDKLMKSEGDMRKKQRQKQKQKPLGRNT